MRIVVTGATGLIGRHLLPALIARGYSVVALTRSPERANAILKSDVTYLQWSHNAPSGKWHAALSEADAVIHLAGQNIAQRWSAKQKQRILDSRVEGTRSLVRAMQASDRRPSVFISGSAVGYYGHSEEWVDESSPPGQGFLADVVKRWEAEATKAETLGVRVACIRTGVVLSPEGGVLHRMLIPFRRYAGGSLGSGAQWLPWIHRDDWVQLVLACLDDEAASGAVNAVAPNPVRMSDFAKTLGRVLRRPSFFTVPAPVLRLILGEMACLVLEGQRVRPTVARSIGYDFRFDQLESALQHLLPESVAR